MLKKKVKKIMVGVCATAFALCAAAGVNKILPEKASADATGITMIDGGQIRTSDPMGLGFVSIVDTAAFTGEYTTGTIIAKEEALDAAGLNSQAGFTIEAIEAYNATATTDVALAEVPNVGWIDEARYAEMGITGLTATQKAFRGSVVNLSEANRERVYCARGFVCVNGTYTYTDYDVEKNARSVQEIAYKANAENAFDGDEEMQAYIAKFLPEKSYAQKVPTLFSAETDTSALVTRGVAGESKSVVTDFGAVEGDYTGTHAVKITSPANNGKYSVKVPQMYYDMVKADADDYVKIGFWMAIEKNDGKTYDHKDGVTVLADNNMLMDKKGFGTTATGTDFNKWIYVEKDVSALANTWKSGEINLFAVWANNTSTNSYQESFNVYIGDVKLISQADIELTKKGILNGVTDENDTQYQLGPSTKGEFKAAGTYALGGGYTGNAVEFNANAGNYYAVELPKVCLPQDKTDKYFSMWFALRTKDTQTAMTGLIQVNTDNKGVFALSSYTYASGGGQLTFAKFDTTNSAGYKTDTWYQLMVPVSAITDAMYLAGTNYLQLWRFWASGFNTDNYAVLIGDIGIVDVATPEGYLLKVNAIEGSANLKGNNDGNMGTYVSAEDVAALGFTNENEYSGAAISFTGINNGYYAALSQADYEKYTNAANGYTKIRIWYAASTVGTVTFINKKTTALMNIESNQNATKGTWTYLEFDISTLNTTTYTNGKVFLFHTWCTAENNTSPTLYVGDIQFIK